jgi:hypothetical protein
VGAVTSQRVLKVLFYANILQCFFVVENFTANAQNDYQKRKRDLKGNMKKRGYSSNLHDNNRKFLHIPFASKGIDAINISNILNGCLGYDVLVCGANMMAEENKFQLLVV